MEVRCLFAAVLLLMLSSAGNVWSAPETYAAGAGGTQPVNLNAAVQSGAYGNPALLGLDRTPRAGLSFLPMSVGIWSDELALPAFYNKYMFIDPNDVGGSWARYFTYILRESFDLWDVRDPETVSRRLTDGMRDGVGAYVGYQIFPMTFSMNGFSASLRTWVDIETRLPGGLLLPFFSYDEGLQRGKRLDFSDLKLDLIAATELAFKVGRPVSALPQIFDYLRLDKGAWGVGVKHVLGHSYLSVSADEGSSLKYDSVSNSYKLNATVNVVSTGTGLNINKLEFESSYWDKTFPDQPVAGEGWGFDIGAVFHNDNHFVSIDMSDIGMIVWDGNKTRRATRHLAPDSLDLNTLLDDFESVFAMDSTIVSGQGHVTYLPMSLNLGYTYYYDLSDRQPLRYMVKYLTANAGLKQQIIAGPGKHIAATLALGGSAGLANGVLPLRYGIIIGGPGKSSSAIGAGVNTRYASFDVYYKAVGHPFLTAKKGYEAAAAFTVNWGWDRKKTGDIITDTATAVLMPDTAAVVSMPDTADSVSIPDTTAVDSVLIPDTSAVVSMPDTADSVLVPDTADSVLMPDTTAVISTPDTIAPPPVPAPVPVAPLPPAPVPVAPPPAPVTPLPEPVPAAPPSPPAPVPVAPFAPVPVVPLPEPVPVAPSAPAPVAPPPASVPVAPPAPIPVAPIPEPVPVAPPIAPEPIVLPPALAPAAPIPEPVSVAPPSVPLPEPVPAAPPIPPALIAPPPVPEPALVPAPVAAPASSSSVFTPEDANRVSELSADINFRAGTAELTAGSQTVLDEITDILNKYPGVRYEIRGYVDFDGANAYVSQKSAERAEAVRKYILSKGAPAANFTTKGYGRNAGAGGGAGTPDGNVVIVPVTKR